MIKDNIKTQRAKVGLTLEEVSKIVGVSKQTIQKYESGVISNIPSDKVELLGKALHTTPAYLMGWEDNMSPQQENTYSELSAPNIIPIPKMKKIPLLGTIACGTPVLANENIEKYIELENEVSADFCLRCRGDSMINARIFDGDYVFIRQQLDVENGEIAAVLIDNEATLKRVYHYDNRIELRAENPTFKSLSYEGEKLAEIRILGKAVYFFSEVR